MSEDVSDASCLGSQPLGTRRLDNMLVYALECVSLLKLSSTGYFWWIPRWSDKDGFCRLKPGLRTSEGLRTLGTLACELRFGSA